MPKKCKKGTWTEKEIEYLKQNYDFKTVKQIAQDLGRGQIATKKKVEELGLHKANRKKADYSEPTLCWNCDNAYAHKCAWIREGKEVWDKAKKRKCIWDGYKEVELVQVLKCKHFVLDKRLRGGKAVEGRI